MNIVETLVDCVIQESVEFYAKPITFDQSDSSSDSDDELLIENEDNKNKPKIKGYVDDVVRKYSYKDFQAHFRLNRTAVEVKIS